MNITLDNSALSHLYCDRRFELTVKHGLVKESNPAINFGSALHKALEYTDTGVELEVMFSRVFAEYPGVDTAKLVKCVGKFLIDSARNSPITLNDNKPAVEVKFKYEYTDLAFIDAGIHIYLAGTIDRIEESNGTLVIRDYKTAGDSTESQIKKKLDYYRMSFQLPFYVHSLFYSGILPAHYIDMLRENKYRTEYTFVFFNFDPPVVKHLLRGPYPESFIKEEVPRIIDNRINQAIRIYRSNDRAPMTGLNTYRGCEYCPFDRACSNAGTEQEQEFLDRFERIEYNPLTFR